MKFKKMVTTVDTHTAGEPTRIVTGGIPHIPGKTMAEKRNWLNENLDTLRRLLMWEPRGHQDMFGAVLTAPVDQSADAGVIFMDSGGYLDMCGHGSIGVSQALVETGMVAVAEGADACEVVMDTPAGRVTARVDMPSEGPGTVTIENVPAFFYDGVDIDLPSIGTVHVNVSYGGNFFGLVHVDQLGLKVELAHLDRLKSLGLEIRDRVNSAMRIVHPGTGQQGRVDLTEIYQDGDPARNVVIFGNGQVDRSPCGTGTCAKMAFLHHEGQLGLDTDYPYLSIAGTRFVGRLVRETRAGERAAVVPQITGSAAITGFHQFVVDPNDAFPRGFLLNADDV